jgi:spore maturation protein CgeB
MKSDFFFCGTSFDSRVEFFDQCDFNGIDIKLGGNWQRDNLDDRYVEWLVHPPDECLDNELTQQFYTSTRASLNLYRREAQRPELAEGWSMNPREVELAASGTFFLRDPRGEGDEVLDMLPTFEGPQDFMERLRWWLNHDSERAAVALKARAAIQDRTFLRNAAELMRHIGG